MKTSVRSGTQSYDLTSAHLSKQSREIETVNPGSPTTWTSRARPSAARQRSRGLVLSSAPNRSDKAGGRISSGPREPRLLPWCWGEVSYGYFVIKSWIVKGLCFSETGAKLCLKKICDAQLLFFFFVNGHLGDVKKMRLLTVCKVSIVSLNVTLQHGCQTPGLEGRF